MKKPGRADEDKLILVEAVVAGVRGNQPNVILGIALHPPTMRERGGGENEFPGV